MITITSKEDENVKNVLSIILLTFFIGRIAGLYNIFVAKIISPNGYSTQDWKNNEDLHDPCKIILRIKNYDWGVSISKTTRILRLEWIQITWILTWFLASAITNNKTTTTNSRTFLDYENDSNDTRESAIRPRYLAQRRRAQWINKRMRSTASGGVQRLHKNSIEGGVFISNHRTS